MISKTHFYYVVSILLTTIILLITAKFGSDQNLVNYISFALTLTSLILALVSIIYSFYSNSSFSENISTLNNATTSMTQTSAKLMDITALLNNKLDELPVLIKGIEGKIDVTYEYLEKSYTGGQSPTNTVELQTLFANNVVGYFMTNTSVSGLLLLYALTLSETFSKPFQLADICEKVDVFEIQYCYGFIIASSSFGLFNMKDENGYYIITNMYHDVRSQIKHKVEIIADIDAREKENTLLKDQIKKIEQYFQ